MLKIHQNMKKNYFLYLVLALVSTVWVSCQKDDVTGDSSLEASDAKATLTFDVPQSIVETDTTFNIKVTLDKPQIADIYIPIHTSGTAENGSDYAIEDIIIIPAYYTSAIKKFKISNDTDIEQDETVTITIGDETVANVDFAQQSRTITIQNAVSPVLDLTFDWDATVTVDGAEVSLCDEVDIDIYVFDADENDLGIYDAATGACPEHSVRDWEDGEYYLWANLYANAVHPADGSVVNFPITITASQSGLFEGDTYQQASTNVIKSSDPSYEEDGSGVFKPVAKITVNGSNYTITPIQ